MAQSQKAYTAKYFSLPLSRANGLAAPIDMVAIAPGRFLMGTSSADIPPASYAVKGNELLSQRMNVASFFMSKTAITQAQWAAVSALPKITRELSPAPSRFQGATIPWKVSHG